MIPVDVIQALPQNRDKNPCCRQRENRRYSDASYSPHDPLRIAGEQTPRTPPTQSIAAPPQPFQSQAALTLLAPVAETPGLPLTPYSTTPINGETHLLQQLSHQARTLRWSRVRRFAQGNPRNVCAPILQPAEI